jgi:hypothetical protein
MQPMASTDEPEGPTDATGRCGLEATELLAEA